MTVIILKMSDIKIFEKRFVYYNFFSFKGD